MGETIKHENILKSRPKDGEEGLHYLQFMCRGCTMMNRKNLWHGFTSSIAGKANWEIDNSYLSLEEEPSNIYDPNAIMVVCRGEFFGTVGYVGKEYTTEIKEILNKCISYRIDMVDESMAGEKEIALILTWKGDGTSGENPLAEKNLRKELGLPITKTLRYMKKKLGGYEEFEVSSLKIVDTYMPSGTHSLMITLANGEKVRILAPFFAHMQKSSFERDMEKIPEE